MSRHRLKLVIVIVACAAIANPVLAGLNDSRAALFGASSSGDRAECASWSTAEAGAER